MEIQVKKGGTGPHKTIREINLVYKGLIRPRNQLEVTRLFFSHERAGSGHKTNKSKSLG